MEAVSSGGEHSCRLPGDGSLLCWGRNSYGQLGDGRKGTQTPTPQRVTKGNPWRRVSAGGGTTCGIKKNERLFCWGVNHRGQLGDGTTKQRLRPVVVAKNKKWTSVNAGWFNTCGITRQTQLYCWGDNAAGQIGDGGKAKVRTKPTLVKKGKNWASVSVGSRFVCATKKTARCSAGAATSSASSATAATRARPSRPAWAPAAAGPRCPPPGPTPAPATPAAESSAGAATPSAVGDGNVTTTPTPRQVVGNLKAVDITTTEGASCAIDDQRPGAVLGQQRVRRDR